MPVTAPDNIQPSDTSEWGRVKNATKSVTDYDAHAAQAHSVAVAPLGTPDNPNSAIFTLANFVTLCRFGLTVAFLYLFVNHADRSLALTLYAVQLAMNALWPLLFFRLSAYLAAFLWLVLLLAVVWMCALTFRYIRKSAGDLLTPYLLWLLFAGYLNLGVYLLN